jgi:hypothetical protein
MRELRTRIAAQHGVDFSTTQIQELAARRLETILAPRSADASLLDALRQSAGTTGTKVPRPQSLPVYTFGDSTLYGSGNGLVQFVRRLLRPLLRLFLNPDSLVKTLATQARINAELTAREQRRDTRQSEWNALHFELVKRMVTETARVSLDVENFTAQIETLTAKIAFNERRVREIEGIVHEFQPQHQRPVQKAGRAIESDNPGEGADSGRRRRRRRGRRSSADTTVSPSITTDTGSEQQLTSEPARTSVVNLSETISTAATESVTGTTELLSESTVPDAATKPAAKNMEPVSSSPKESAKAKKSEQSVSSSEPTGSTNSSKWQQVFSPPPQDKDTSRS